MAALDEVKSQATGQQLASGVSLTPQLWEELKPFIGTFFWNWYESNKDLVLLNVGFWIFKVNIQVHDLDQLFTMLFGPKQST